MNIAHWLERTALRHPDQIAIFVGAAPWLTYAELVKRVQALAGHLSDQGVKSGSRVAVFSANCPQYLEILQAIHWCGAISVPINYKLHPKELAYIVDDAGVNFLFISQALAEQIHDVQICSCERLVIGSQAYEQGLLHSPLPIQHRQPTDIASLFYTSGTTGRPKGVMQTHRNLMTMTACYLLQVDDTQVDDAMVYAAPMSHGAGLYHYAHILRAAHHVVPESGGFDPQELVNLAQSVKKLCLFAAPTMVKRLVSHIQATGAEVDGFKTIIYGGGPMYLEDIREAIDCMGPRFVQIYGQGESPMTITVLTKKHLAERHNPDYQKHLASVGVAQPLVEVRVVDELGNVLPTEQVGEVQVRGDTVMAGYWNNPAATQSAIHDGWLSTGDTGYLDGNGFLTLKDRTKDLIISGGSNIYPREIEEVLLAFPGVREVAVAGQNDPEWGEIPVAFVVMEKDWTATQEQLDAWCLDNLARFKRPKTYIFLDDLPKNSYGKILKTILRESFQHS